MAQARAALLGVRQAGLRQPVLVVCRCDEEGRTPTGGDVLACGIVMQGMGAAAFGLHCSDPDALEEQLSRLHQYLDQSQTALPSFRKYERKYLKKRKEGVPSGKPA